MSNSYQIFIISGILTLIGLVVLIFFILKKLNINALEKTTDIEDANEQEVFNLKQLIIHLSDRNNLLNELKKDMAYIKKNNHRFKLNTINDTDWALFNVYFNDIYPLFYNDVLKYYPDISTHELHIMALLKLDMSNQQIAHTLAISSEGIKKARYRLRKKMHLETSQSLEETILSI